MSLNVNLTIPQDSILRGGPSRRPYTDPGNRYNTMSGVASMSNEARAPKFKNQESMIPLTDSNPMQNMLLLSNSYLELMMISY